AERSFATVGPSDGEVALHLIEVWVSLSIKPDADRVGCADQFPIDNLQATRVASERGVISHVIVPVDRGNGGANVARNGPGLVCQKANGEDPVPRVGGEKC